MRARLAIVMLLLATGYVAPAQQSRSPEVDRLLAEARRLAPEQPARALEAALRARNAAQQAAVADQRAQAELLVGWLLERNPQLDKSGGADVRAAYEEAARLGTGDLRRVAQNNLGVYLTRRGDYAGAVNVLRSMDLSEAGTEERRALFQYNLARALELSGELQGAFMTYRAALDSNPDYRLAAQRAFQLLFDNSWPERAAGAAELISHLVKTGRTQRAAEYLYPSIERLGGDARAQQLLVAGLRYWQVAAISPKRFDESDWGKLSNAAGGHAALRDPVRQIGQAYLVEFPLRLEPGQTKGWTLDQEVGGLFPAWSKEPWAEPFSLFLAWVGSAYAAQGAPSMALSRYAAAWMLDHSNTRAALDTAVLLRTHGASLDPKGLLQEKLNRTYAPGAGNPLTWMPRRIVSLGGRKQALTEQNYDDLRRMYAVLAEITPAGPGARAATDVQQAQRAVEFDAKYATSARGAERSPGLYLSLAVAYEKDQKPGPAAENYLQAAQRFAAAGEREEAVRWARKALELASPSAPAAGRAKKLLESLR